MYVCIYVAGVSLCLTVDPFDNWVALGTSLGYHVIWDMRFQLPISTWQHAGHAGKCKLPLQVYFCLIPNLYS